MSRKCLLGILGVGLAIAVLWAVGCRDGRWQGDVAFALTASSHLSLPLPTITPALPKVRNTKSRSVGSRTASKSSKKSVPPTKNSKYPNSSAELKKTTTRCRAASGCALSANVASWMSPKQPGSERLSRGACIQELTSRGIAFRRRRNPRRWLSRRQRLRCSVVDAVRVYPPIHGVDWVNGYRERVPLFMRCETALALSRLSLYLRRRGIVRVMHFGTYHCKRVRKDRGYIGKISQHGLGRAIDIAAFWDDQNRLYSVAKHWDRRTRWKDKKGQLGCWSTRFRHTKAQFLYNIACDIWRLKLFPQLLTPNYNRVHRDHFHVDLAGPSQGEVGDIDGYRK